MFATASVRQPAVAGLFYPLDSGELRDTVSKLLEDTAAKQLPATPQAFIVPHAGYIYSGGTAASAYALIAAQRGKVNKVVLVGPSHRVYLNGVALPEAGAFATPLGIVPIDAELHNELKNYPGVIESDQPHRFEHSLEVQLPFLQMVLGEFSLVPLVAGIAPAALIASVLARAWQDPQTLVIASSDLSHYHSYAEAQRIDEATSSAILRRESTLTGDQACGAVALNGLLEAARERDLAVDELARCNSGDTAGDRNRVVGYGAYALYEAH